MINWIFDHPWKAILLYWPIFSIVYYLWVTTEDPMTKGWAGIMFTLLAYSALLLVVWIGNVIVDHLH